MNSRLGERKPTHNPRGWSTQHRARSRSHGARRAVHDVRETIPRRTSGQEPRGPPTATKRRPKERPSGGFSRVVDWRTRGVRRRSWRVLFDELDDVVDDALGRLVGRLGRVVDVDRDVGLLVECSAVVEDGGDVGRVALEQGPRGGVAGGEALGEDVDRRVEPHHNARAQRGPVALLRHDAAARRDDEPHVGRDLLEDGRLGRAKRRLALAREHVGDRHI
mmetsp:Transcript_2959/g.11280  ORF Transcript_2959/g.11280 Transcript_2959/m.11280 type:complete len:220 (+) Transcript_2959:208-867(+)